MSVGERSEGFVFGRAASRVGLEVAVGRGESFRKVKEREVDRRRHARRGRDENSSPIAYRVRDNGKGIEEEIGLAEGGGGFSWFEKGDETTAAALKSEFGEFL